MKIRLTPPIRLETRLNNKIKSLLKDVEDRFKRMDADIAFRDVVTIGEIDSSFKGVINDIDRDELKVWLNDFYKDVFDYVLTKIKKPHLELSKNEIELISFYVIQTLELVEVAMSDFSKDVGYILSNGLIEGKTIQELTKELIKATNMSRNRAETIAISQTSNANSRFARESFKRLKINNATWSSAKDKRVRKCHLARSGVSYNVDEGCYSPCDGRYLHTGQEVRCRCAMIIELF